ncbi:recombinase family protein [Curtobacterium flaccumfaciens pv. flaccumfaciens]|uniref:recombinase family protein n=1 Tax=Curtobacterium flaccumfaciens TaxID=2035 RepID=UPI00399267C0
MVTAGVRRVFRDIAQSGAFSSRPELHRLLDYVREGDTLDVWRLDRLGRNTRHVLEVVELLGARGVGFRSLTEGLDTTDSMGRAMLTVMAAFATLERGIMIKRARAGLDAAGAHGRTVGVPEALMRSS